MGRKRGIALLPPGAKIELEITGLDDEGRGRGHVELSGQLVDVAVRGAVPGDRARATVQRVFPAIPLLLARAREVVRFGDARIEARCGHPAPCVGCPLDPLEPSLELALKRGLVELALEGAGLEIDDPLVPAYALGRRQKVKLVPDKHGRTLGLYAPWSHHVVDAHDCARHHPALGPALRGLRDALGQSLADLKAVVARVFQEGVAVVLVSPRALEARDWAAVRALVDDGVLAGAAQRVDESGSNSVVGGGIVAVHGGLWFSPLGHAGAQETVDAFCQPDPWLAEDMYALCAAWVRDAGTRALDLYAGSGGFTRHLRARGCEVTGVESYAVGERSLVENGARAIIRPVSEALPGLGPVDAIVADPPRKGLGDDAAGIAQLGAGRLALVSCDTRALRRDLDALRAGGYRVARVVPVDLFAGAARIEVVSLLERA